MCTKWRLCSRGSHGRMTYSKTHPIHMTINGCDFIDICMHQHSKGSSWNRRGRISPHFKCTCIPIFANRRMLQSLSPSCSKILVPTWTLDIKYEVLQHLMGGVMGGLWLRLRNSKVTMIPSWSHAQLAYWSTFHRMPWNSFGKWPKASSTSHIEKVSIPFPQT